MKKDKKKKKSVKKFNSFFRKWGNLIMLLIGIAQTGIVVFALLYAIKQTKIAKENIQYQINEINNRDNTSWLCKIENDSNNTLSKQFLIITPTNENCIIEEIVLHYYTDYQFHQETFLGDIIPLEKFLRLLTKDIDLCIVFSSNKYLQVQNCYYTPIIIDISYYYNNIKKKSRGLYHILSDKQIYDEYNALYIVRGKYIKPLEQNSSAKFAIINDYYYGLSSGGADCIINDHITHTINTSTALFNIGKYNNRNFHYTIIQDTLENSMMIPKIILNLDYLQTSYNYLLKGLKHTSSVSLRQKTLDVVNFETFYRKAIIEITENSIGKRKFTISEREKIDKYLEYWKEVNIKLNNKIIHCAKLINLEKL